MVTFQPGLLKEKIASKLSRDGEESWKRPRAHHGVFGHFENPWPSGKESSLPDQFPFEAEKELPKSIKREANEGYVTSTTIDDWHRVQASRSLSQTLSRRWT
jgi:hypothetical protein